MSSRDHNKPPGKPDQRSRQAKQGSRKPDQRESLKPDQRQRPKRDQQPDRQQDDKELIEAAVASSETFPIEAEASTGASSIEAAVASTEILPKEAAASAGVSSMEAPVASTETPFKGALVPIDAFRIGTAVSVDTFWIGFQTIANAYGDYIRKSIDETRSFLEKLTVVRSPDKAIEVQTEFAKQACETLLSDSHRILKLYSELARQIFRPFERLVTRVTQTAR
jgi:phasin family protein